MRQHDHGDHAFLKQAANHAHMVALSRPHGCPLTPTWLPSTTSGSTSRGRKTLRCSPTMAAGLSTTLWSMKDIVGLVDARNAPAAKRGSYKPRAPKVA